LLADSISLIDLFERLAMTHHQIVVLGHLVIYFI
jgi:hypothetical protein